MCQELVSQRADGEDVGSGIRPAAEDLFRREVSDRADDVSGTRQRSRLPLEFRDPEVEDLDLAVGEQHHVGRLDVAVQDAPRVGVRDRIGDGSPGRVSLST